VAETAVSGPFDDAVSAGFRRLFAYISGANRPAAKIEMTAPVLTSPEGEKIPMTAPVFVDPAGGGWTVAFVLPAGVTSATAPQPTDPQVTLRDVPARQVAVVRFSGRFRREAAEANRERLAAWLAARDLKPADDWQFAGYNPPWTIPALRRNEVLVTLR
jgi:hypothetical protein